MKETKIYADEFCTTFASTTEMLEFLAERAKQSKWIRKPTRMLKLVPLEKEAETIEEACEKELEGIVEDTEKNTQLVLKVNKDFYPVRDCAIHTILKRAGINGTGLKKLEKATYGTVLSRSTSQWKYDWRGNGYRTDDKSGNDSGNWICTSYAADAF